MNSFLPGDSDIVVPGIMIVLGLIGIVIPIIPGLILAVLGVALWAFEVGGSTAWTVFVVCALMYAAGLVVQFLIPGKHLKSVGAHNSTLVIALIVGIAGMFVIPIVGLPIGFVGAIYLLERTRSRDRHAAWTRTRAALKAVLMNIGIELVTGFSIAMAWLSGVWLTR